MSLCCFFLTYFTPSSVSIVDFEKVSVSGLVDQCPFKHYYFLKWSKYEKNEVYFLALPKLFQKLCEIYHDITAVSINLDHTITEIQSGDTLCLDLNSSSAKIYFLSISDTFSINAKLWAYFIHLSSAP